MINDSINRFLGVLCYPYTTREVFRRDGIQEYIAQLHGGGDEQNLKRIREELKRELIGYIRKNYTIYSYDEIYLYLEKCFLYHAENYGDSLELYEWTMRKMAKTLISHRDGRIVFKYWKNEDDEAVFGGFAGGNKVNLFHSISCHMPMDVIAIVYMIINQREQDASCLDDFYGNIEIADQQLSRILQQGVAENHLHKGVSRTFSSIWDSLMEPLTARKGKAFLDKEFVSGTRDENKEMLFYILGCGIVRAWLVLHFSPDRVEPEDEEDDRENGTGLESVGQLAEKFRKGMPFESFYKENFREKEERDIIAYYVGLWESLAEILPEEALEGRFCTKVLRENTQLHTFDENVFLYYALSHFLNSAAPLEHKQCFMQYLRIRGYLFHVSVQQKTIKGLDYFQQAHYNVNSTLNHINTSNFWENAIREQLQNPDLRKVEFRTSMPDTYSRFKKDVLSFLKAYQKILREDYYDRTETMPYSRIPQVGLVIHFLKRPDAQGCEKCIQNAHQNCSYLQFGRLQKAYEKQIDAFIRLRSEHSEMSRYLVGIDAASLENSTPVWVFAPIYERARDSSVERVGKSGSFGEYIQSLGFTFHAGEDFRHILSGLRRMDEAVEYLKFHAGDRIGHGIALGIRAREWRKQNPVVIIPQMEALENYLWAYDTLSRNYSDFQAAVLAYMEQRILYFAEKIYGTPGLPVETLIAGYHGLFQGTMVTDALEEKYEYIRENLCKKLQEGKKISWDADLFVAARHCKRFVRRMEEPIHYEVTEQDLLMIEELQKILKEKLGKKGIVIEVNPSSNTAIGDLDVLEENQLYQMNRPNDVQNVLVCVNSDDPAVFNTNVSNELAYIYYGMLEQGIAREAALLWMDRIRRNGVDSSFIRRQESDAMLLKRLSDLIHQM